MVKLIDTHSHLDFSDFDNDRDDVIRRANLSGVKYIINVGSSIEGSENSLALAQKYEAVYAAVGVHPHDADSAGNQAAKIISGLAAEKKVVAIGEIGLDYYRDYSSRQNQKALFISLLNTAKQLGLPVVLHIRDAQEDTLDIIKDFLPLQAVVHCFSGDEDFMRQCLEMGFMFSFTCNITYKKADKLRQVVKLLPLDKIMLETDCPYLSPEGFRGRRNEPFQVKLLAEYIAGLRGISFEETGTATTDNAKRFFRIK